MHSKNKHVCPVCGYSDLDEPPYDEYNCPTYIICPSCGVEFGVDDFNKDFLQLRRQWVDSEKKWWNPNRKPPENWDPEKQLANLLNKKSKKDKLQKKEK